MRRIDLFCKLLAPVFISLIDSLSTRYAIWTVFGLNTASVLIEYVAIAQVYQAVPALKKQIPASPTQDPDDIQYGNQDSNHTRSPADIPQINQSQSPWKEYTTSPVFLASFALSLLYLTVLSFGATMVTYLLHTGFTSLQVSYMRIGSVAAELSGTWTAPMIMNRIGPIRSGLWFLNWQFVCVAAAAVAFVGWDSDSRVVAGTLIVGVAMSRVGLWGFDLSVQFLVQEVSYPFALFDIHVDVVIVLILITYRIHRISRNMRALVSLLRRWRCRMFSKCFLSLPLLHFRFPGNFDTPCSSVLELWP